MSTRLLYDQWSATYDEVENKTRDLEKIAGQQVLSDISADSIIELGCGTGKNTEWLVTKANHVTAIDLSEEMMAVARKKITSSSVVFQQADITQAWTFTDRKADLITCSLILEHIEDLNLVFEPVASHLKEGGYFYVCELHPFKQYQGSKARFETSNGTQVLDCYIHHISSYLKAAESNGLGLSKFEEWFDDDTIGSIPRLVSFLFKK
jgi:ubiquinone/menaquinone biosynthesis C-methylase UbiE